MTNRIPAPAPPGNSRPPRRPEKHSGAADIVAFRVLGEPLPCGCPACLERLAAWDRERAGHLAASETLPPAFWTRQASRLFAASRGPAPRWRLALVPAAVLLLASALFVLPARSGRAPDDFEARWAEVEAAMKRPVLGDLEACAILIGEEENMTMEESR